VRIPKATKGRNPFEPKKRGWQERAAPRMGLNRKPNADHNNIAAAQKEKREKGPMGGGDRQ